MITPIIEFGGLLEGESVAGALVVGAGTLSLPVTDDPVEGAELKYEAGEAEGNGVEGLDSTSCDPELTSPAGLGAGDIAEE